MTAADTVSPAHRGDAACRSSAVSDVLFLTEERDVPMTSRESRASESVPIEPRTRIGHVHLKVADLDRALAFYCGVLGFELTQRYGAQAAFISAG
jgi:catechol-2,3-dioxygenase